MGRIANAQRVGDEIDPLVKHVTQEAINLFEGSAGRSAPSQFTDEATARETLGTEGTVASGRMSLSFALQFLRRHFGSEVYNHNGMVDLRFLRPVRPRDTITISGTITDVSREASGRRVSVDVKMTNQRGDTVGVGMGSAIVPNAFFPSEE